MAKESYTRHSRLVSQIRETVNVLAYESESFHERARKKNDTQQTSQSVDRSSEWIKGAQQALIMAAIAVRDAEEELEHTN